MKSTFFNIVIMKVQVGHLKANLSAYLRKVRDTGEPIEVCVREKGVAYLTPKQTARPEDVANQAQLEQQLHRRGLSIAQWGKMSAFTPNPEPAGDGRQVENSVIAMRSEKDW